MSQNILHGLHCKIQCLNVAQEKKSNILMDVQQGHIINGGSTEQISFNDYFCRMCSALSFKIDYCGYYYHGPLKPLAYFQGSLFPDLLGKMSMSNSRLYIKYSIFPGIYLGINCNKCDIFPAYGEADILRA